jgi:hypothetical protein
MRFSKLDDSKIEVDSSMSAVKSGMLCGRDMVGGGDGSASDSGMRWQQKVSSKLFAK